MITRDIEQLAIGAARWICDHGRELGFRTPDVNERARVAGCAYYLMSLGLEEDQLLAAQGNHFDPGALLVRIARFITNWLRGEPLAQHTYLDIDALTSSYQELRSRVACTVPTSDDPIPRDIMDILRYTMLPLPVGPPRRNDA